MDASTVFDARHCSLGDILVKVGILTAERLAQVRNQTHTSEKELGQVLVALGVTTEEKLHKALSLKLGIPCFDTFEGMMESEAAALLPEMLARRHLAVPLLLAEEGLVVGMVNPVDIVAVDELALRSGKRILPVMTSLPNLLAAIQTAYPREGIQPQLVSPSGAEEPSIPAPANGETPQDQSVVANVDGLFREAMNRRASDIHVEAGETAARVRFRVDGLLQDGPIFDKNLQSALAARVKILARLDITETRLPQDGRLRFDFQGRPVDVRVSTVPGVNGEKVVLRLLDSTRAVRKLEDLMLAPEILSGFRGAVKRANRIVLVTGPTGSGKTTTLYAALSELNDPTTNIVTLEDPVEYRIDRITQIEAQPRIGLTFAAGLRAILRQDPNVILVGEIRDLETAEIAVQAAITGHRVFSTLHTSDAVTAVHRLITMRVEPFLIAAALGGVLAQRLMRRLCERCRKPHTPTETERRILEGRVGSNATFFEAVGCSACLDSGYAGRLAVHEWLAIGPALREKILARESVDILRQSAIAEGWRPLEDDAIRKAAQGLTSLAEAFRVTRDEAGA